MLWDDPAMTDKSQFDVQVTVRGRVVAANAGDALSVIGDAIRSGIGQEWEDRQFSIDSGQALKVRDPDPYSVRLEAERIIGEDRVPQVELIELIQRYGSDDA